MMEPMANSNSMASEPMEQEMEQDVSPIDGIISRVDSYMANPAQVTPETLGELKMELMDLKAFLDGGEQDESPMPQQGSMSGALGGME